MIFHFVDIQADVVNAWHQVFDDISAIHISQDSIFNHPADALVSPANSYGYMNGGIDFLISKNLGWHIEKELQAKIRNRHFGELLVGQAEILPTGSDMFPYLISAPTMRNPMSITYSPNVYLAMRAILIMALHGRFEDGTPVSDKVQHIALPGLGTGVGQMPPLVMARQMRLVWEDIMDKNYETVAGWEKMGKSFAYFSTHRKEDLGREMK